MNESFSTEHRGCRLFARLRGDGSPILLIQGAGIHGDGWNPQIEALASKHCCLTFDNRGMGQSQPVGVPLSIEQMADDALVLMDKLGWKEADVVGHSMGGLVALHLALAARQRVRSLALLCTFGRGREATRLSPWMLWVGLRTRIGTRRQRRHAFLKLVMPPELLASSDLDALAEKLKPLFGHDLADQPPIVMTQLKAMSSYDATPRLSELVGLPTLVVSAFHDRIAQPAFGQSLAAGIPGSRYIEIDDAAHGVPIQQPGRINDLLLAHFASRKTCA